MKTYIEITHAPIVAPALELSGREIGACLEFSGVVRELENGKKISGLYYEAHEPMARKTLEQILQQLSTRHSCEAVWFIHRLGFVPAGEASLFIRIISQHRQASLGLMGEMINQLKADVPIWKRADET